MQKTVQVVIEIGEECYKRIMRAKEFNLLLGKLEAAIANGTVLPKHGQLGDLDELYKKVQNEENDTEDERYIKALFRYLIRQADTILEATEGENG